MKKIKIWAKENKGSYINKGNWKKSKATEIIWSMIVQKGWEIQYIQSEVVDKEWFNW